MAEKEVVYLAYHGQDFEGDHVYLQLDDEKYESGLAYQKRYFKKNLLSAPVGAIMTFEASRTETNGLSVDARTGKMVGRVDREIAMKWQIDSATAVASKKAKNAANQAAAQQNAELFSQLREIYWSKRNKADRAAFLAVVIEAITRG